MTPFSKNFFMSLRMWGQIGLLTSTFLLITSYLSSLIYLWPLIFSWCWLKWYFFFELKIPLTPYLLRFLPHLHMFYDSILSLKIPVRKSLVLFALSFFLFKLPIATPLFILSLLTQIRLPSKKEKAPLFIWSFPKEKFQSLSPAYPLLRKTTGFIGPKRFSTHLKNPNILFIYLESFRAKNICPQYSPNFCKLIEKGVYFPNFYANGLQTFRAAISSLFGVHAYKKGKSLYPFCSTPMIGLPQILKSSGYHLALMQSGYTAFDWTYPFFKSHGFETIIGREKWPDENHTSWGVKDETLFSFASDWLKQQTKPAFLNLFTITNHHPWKSPIPFQTPDHLAPTYRRFLQTFSYTDHCLGLFEKSMENSLVFIFGDHGQDMGERNPQVAIHNDVYEENIHVPLLILGAGRGRFEERASQVDLLPTVLDLLNLQAVHHSIGQSLAREPSFPVYFSNPGHLKGLIQGKTKVILGEVEECYDLEKDPEEKNPLKVPETLKKEINSHFQTFESIELAPKNGEKLWIDLSKKGDEAILNLKTKDLYAIDLSRSLKITDKSLDWLSHFCPNLSILIAAECPLLTQKGIETFLEKSSSLISLNLDGHDDLKELNVSKNLHLFALRLIGCPSFKGEALVKLAAQCPNLNYLAFSLESVEKEHLTQLSKYVKNLIYLEIEGTEKVGLEATLPLLKANPRIDTLILDGQESRLSHSKPV